MFDGPPRRRLSPPLVTVVSLAAILIAMRILQFHADNGSDASRRFVTGVPWYAWTAVAGLSLAIFVVSFVIGLTTIVQPSEDLGLRSVPPRRRYGYLAVACALIMLLAVAMFAGTGAPPAVASMPVGHILLRTRGVVLVGFTATIPWLALVWLAHATCNELRMSVASMPAEQVVRTAGDAPGTTAGGDAIRSTVDRLQRLWRLMTWCVTAAAISVVVAIVTAGALRAAFLSYAPGRADDFPASNVLLYGALFAVLQAAIGLPLVVSWRARARELVERAYPLPIDGQPTDSWLAERRRMETLLHLNVSLLRNPLAALSVLAPLATSALAVFIPQLGGG